MSATNRLIYLLGFLKLFIHLLTNTNYGLHRDEFLYYDEGQHLGWGFMEVPPFTPFLAKIADLLGGSVFAIRLFPALAGMAIVVLAGFLVKSLGGKNWAVLFTCLSLIFSPVLLGSNTLFQPVSFNQFFWFLSAFLLIKAVQKESVNYWYLLGLSFGIGFMNKYSIVFYALSLIIGILISKERKWLTTKYPYQAFVIAFLIALPNLLWQYNHNLPVMAHMKELSETQLVHVNWFGFIFDQITYFFSFTVIWVVGIFALFKMKNLQPFRFVAWAFLSCMFLIIVLGGKSYYTIGAYIILFPFGGLYLEKIIQKKLYRYAFIILLIAASMPTMPYALPLLKINAMKSYCAYMAENFGLKETLRWEDGNYYPLPQDYADMHGWEEMVQRVANVYHNIPAGEQCMIWGGSYAHAGAVNYFREKYDLPEAVGTNSSYKIWAPSDVNFTQQILIDDRRSAEESQWFEKVTLVDSVRNEYAREKGYLYYRRNPKIDVNAAWKEMVLEEKQRFNIE